MDVRKFSLRKYGIFIILIFLIIVFSVSTSTFLASKNLLNIAVKFQ
jgi:ABC-type xylose transport system permease subunit